MNDMTPLPRPEAKVTVVGDTVVRKYHISANTVLTGHVHSYDHLSILISGHGVLFREGEGPERLHGPASVVIKAGVLHSFHALTACVWDCLHSFRDLEAAKAIGDTVNLEGVP